MNIGFQFDVKYKDKDLIEVRVSAWNGAFGGRADVYVGTGQLEAIATALKGFPRDTADVREIMLGAFGREHAGGGVTMRFYCIDGSGHACVESRVESGETASSVLESVTLLLPVEPSAVDAFVDQLRQLGVRGTGIALLEGSVASSRR